MNFSALLTHNEIPGGKTVTTLHINGMEVGRIESGAYIRRRFVYPHGEELITIRNLPRPKPSESLATLVVHALQTLDLLGEVKGTHSRLMVQQYDGSYKTFLNGQPKALEHRKPGLENLAQLGPISLFITNALTADREIELADQKPA